MARMLAAMEGSHCPSCHAKPGPDCYDKGKGTRHRKRIEQRQVAAEVRDVLAAPSPWVPYVDLSDCEHGCNGSPCGSSRCTFICHPPIP